MRRGRRDTRPEWIWVLRTASRLLALGSLLLLLGSLVIVGLGGIVLGRYGSLGLFVLGFGFIGLTVVAVLIHLLGWSALSEGALPSVPMRVIFFASLVGFVGGVIYFLIARVLEPGFFLLFGGWIFIPYMPIVYGPVVLAHAAIFLLASGRPHTGPVPYFVIAGSGALVAIATVGLYLQLSNPTFPFPPGFSLSLAGATCVGYGLIALGLDEEYERSGELPKATEAQPS